MANTPSTPDSTKETHLWKRVATVARVLLGLGLLAWVLQRGDTRRAVVDLFTTWWLLPSVGALVLGGAAIESLRLSLLLRSQGIDLTCANAYRVISIGALFNFAIPGGTGGDVMKLWFLAADRKGARVEVATSLLVDRIVSMVSILIVLLLLAAFNTDLLAQHRTYQALILGSALLLLVVFLGAALATSPNLRSRRIYRSLLDRMPFGRYCERALDALFAFRHQWRVLLATAGISMLGHCLLLSMISLAAIAVLESNPLSAICMLSILGMLANVLPLTPGGIGVGEAAFDELFAIAGYGVGSPILIAWRVAQLPLICIGAICYATGLKIRREADLA